MPRVFVISEDWTLRTAVRAELREAGIEAMGFDSPEDAAHAASEGAPPDVTVLDLACADAGHPGLAPLLQRTALLLVAPGIEAPPEAPPGAFVLRRPVRVSEIAAAVRQIFKGQQA